MWTYFALNRLLFLCHYINCWLLDSLHCLSLHHNVRFFVYDPNISSLVLYNMSRVFQYLKTSVCWYCVTMFTDEYYSFSNASHCLTMYQMLFIFPCAHCSLLESVECLSVPHNVPSVSSLSPSPLLPSKVCPQTAITSHGTLWCLCVNVSAAVF